MKKMVVIFGFIFAFQAQAETQIFLPPVETASAIDLQQYLGKWYEIAAIPQSFEKQCVGNTTAEYADAGDGLISIVNTCDTASGQLSEARGMAKVVDSTTQSKLKVTFVYIFGWRFLFGGPYWILGVGDNYSYAVVGAPGRDGAWILSRTPALPEGKMNEAVQVLVAQGFNICQLVSTVQASGTQEKASLCKFLSESHH